MGVIDIDVETYSACDIGLGATVYSQDKTTELLCMAAIVDGVEYDFAPMFPDVDNIAKPPFWFIKAIENNSTFRAHNASFERGVCKMLHTRHGWPKIPDHLWYCVAAQAAQVGLPRSLGDAAKQFGLDEQKDIEGKKLIELLCKPSKSGTRIQEPKALLRLLSYCKQDVRTHRALAEKLPPLRDFDRRVWAVDQKINDRGVPVNKPRAVKMLKINDSFVASKVSDIGRITNGEVKKPSEVAKIKKYCAKHGVAIESLNKDALEIKLKEDIPKTVKDVLYIRKLAGKSSISKLTHITTLPRHINNLHDLFLFNGAQATGRWAGRGFQIQNMPRPLKGLNIDQAVKDIDDLPIDAFLHKYENPIGVLASCLRSVIEAPRGFKLYPVDWSAIESRLLFWAANEESGLHIYRTHGKIYETMAAVIFQKKIEEILKDSFERFVGKETILGFGYGMGVERAFSDWTMKGVPGVTKELVERARTSYHNQFPKIQSFWKATENAAFAALRTPGSPITVTRFVWCYKAPYLMCKLPSGRILYYFRPRIVKERKDGWEQTKLSYMGVNKGVFTTLYTYGAKLVENKIQAIANDVLRQALVRCETECINVIGHIHDEIIPLESDGFNLNGLEKLMCDSRGWLDGAPLAAEGKSMQRFGK